MTVRDVEGMPTKTETKMSVYTPTGMKQGEKQ